MKIVIAGAGAIGGYIGARLAQAGADVVLHARGAHLQAMQTRGLRVTSADRDFEVRPQATGNLSSIGKADVVFLGVKAHSLTAFTASRHFAISVLASDQGTISNRFAISSADKWKVSLRPFKDGLFASCEGRMRVVFPEGERYP